MADVNLRAGPGNEFPRTGSVARGTAVGVLGEDMGWMRIRLSDGSEGFIYRKWLQPVGGDGRTAP